MEAPARWTRSLSLRIAVAFVLLPLSAAASAAERGTTPPAPQAVESVAVASGVTLPLRELAPPVSARVESASPAPDAPLGSTVTLGGWDGVRNLFGVSPASPSGAAGPNHYVQWVNLALAAWTKDGTQVLAPVNGNMIWGGLGGVCSYSNEGTPSVLYDVLADRWVIGQAAYTSTSTGPFYMALAVSQTGDPTGAWYTYCFHLGNKLPYPTTIGVWTDGYYMTADQYTTTGEWGGEAAFVFDRASMLAGGPGRLVSFDLFATDERFGRLVPAHFAGSASMAPPPGTPGMLFEVDDDPSFGTPPALRAWSVHVDWATPANSTIGLSGQPDQVIPTAAYSPVPCTTCVPQLNVTTKLDNRGPGLMPPVQYRNWGTHEGVVANHTVLADGSTRAGLRWYELRRAGSTWSIYQQGTYAPQDTLHRWIGSIGMDHSGNIAIGFSAAGGAAFPSIRYAGRLATDAPGQLPTGDVELKASAGAQTGNSRWGDYSTLAIDPIDDCTYWYTNEYTTGGQNWRTWIGSFKFPSCNSGPPGTITGIVRRAGDGSAVKGATVTATEGPNAFAGVSGADGRYAITAPAGNYGVTAAAYGFTTSLSALVPVAPSATATRDIQLAPLPASTLSGIVRDASTGWPLYASLAITNYPDTIWTDPVSGAYSVSLVQGASHTLTVSTWVPGYDVASWSATVPTSNLVKDFALSPAGTCTAPGYARNGYAVSWEGLTPPFIPRTWSQTQVNGSATWYTSAGTVHPAGMEAHSAPNLVYFNSYSAIAGASARLVKAGGFNLATMNNPVAQFWMYHDTGYASQADQVQVQVSLNSGGTWQNVGSPIFRYAANPGWSFHSVPLTGFEGILTDVRVGLLGTSAYGNDCHLDDIYIGDANGCAVPAGGLVVGTVHDRRQPDIPLPGATISSDGGGVATAAFAADPAVADAFYTLYTPAGSRVLSAAAPRYSTVAANVTVPAHGTVRSNFALGYVGGPVAAVGTPVRIAPTADHQGGTVAWDATGCPSADYHIVYGVGSGLASGTPQGGICALGHTGSFVWNNMPDPTGDPSRLLWFVLVGDDGVATEGSWGTTSAGAERRGPVASGVCGFTTKLTTNSCPVPEPAISIRP